MGNFDRFLQSPVGIDRNGVELSMLTVLARQDLDPWDAAMRLSRLGRDPATRSLAALLEQVLPGFLSRPDRTEMASTLVSLLPADRVAVPGESLHRIQVIIGLMVMMLTMRWLLIGAATIEPGATPAAAATTVTRASVADRTEPARPRE
jgi:hypothetical protein